MKLNKLMLIVGSFCSLLAVTVVSTASWTLIHGEAVPEELK
ncbi:MULTISPECIES: hypothetical protein [Paenibacillus]|jgi:hypothetical protein|uniref:Cyclic lactone autoinducer peptide n=2 Tax=Paenibacillus TaxID=44249 RepID=A0A378Y0B0_PAEPO|nr:MULTISPECIES: hypothetical protein [Paenibacillus]MDR6779436.1 hypothetical protein [Paenibacillus peoriae]SUA70268.1 Uncharacterised protein [Paenibacillus polymyxa]